MWSSIRFPYLFLWLALVLGGFYSANALAGWSYPSCSAASGGGACSGDQSATEACLDAYYGWLGARTYNPVSGGETPWTSQVIYGSFQATTISCTGTPVDDTPNPCPAKAGQSAIPSGMIAYGENAEGTAPSTARMCDASLCVIKVNHSTTIPIGGGLQANYITNGTYTGEQATGPNNCPVTVQAPSPNDPSLPKPIDTVTPDASTPDGVPASQSDCPSGSAFGQVNGVNVCSPPGSQQGYVPDTTTTINNGIEGSSTKDVVKTVGEDGSVTTTTTTNSTIGGNSSTTTTTTNNGGANGLNGADGADGKDADPIDFGPAPAAESGDAPTVPGLEPGTGADGAGGAVKTLTIGNHFTGSGSCIADRSVTVLGVTVTVPLSELCPWFDVMYKVVSLMAIFAAMRILVMS